MLEETSKTIWHSGGAKGEPASSGQFPPLQAFGKPNSRSSNEPRSPCSATTGQSPLSQQVQVASVWSLSHTCSSQTSTTFPGSLTLPLHGTTGSDMYPLDLRALLAAKTGGMLNRRRKPAPDLASLAQPPKSMGDGLGPEAWYVIFTA